MGQDDLLAFRREDDRVLAGDVAAAQGGKADLTARPGPDLALARLAGNCIEADAATLGGSLAQHQRGAGGGIHLVAVVHLDDLDVVVGIEGAGDLLGHQLQQVHAEAHVGGLHHHGLDRRRFDDRLLLRTETSGADHVDHLGLRGQRGVAAGRRGAGEVDHRICLGEERHRVVAHRDAERAGANQLTEVAADGRVARLVAAAGNDAALGGVDGGQIHAAHAAGAADDGHSIGIHLALRTAKFRRGSRFSTGGAGRKWRSRPHRWA